MTSKQHSSLADLRAEKQALKQQLKSDIDNLKRDLCDCFMPRNKAFVNASSKYMKYVGYAITIYKTVTTLRGAFKFLSKLR